ncbi:hypothetical protein [Enterococcus sp. AZ072]|uniref:hypothetical protein n=1 Tax=unclassified Enterococcus TaxID=2608891 RepID=UPI003D26E7D4
MRRKIFAATLLATIFLLGACQQSHTNTTATSTKQTSSIGKKSISSSTTDSRIINSSSEKQSNDTADSFDNASDTISNARKLLVGQRFSMAPVLYDGEDATKAMEENKAPQNLIHDGVAGFYFIDDSTVHVELAGTYRPDHDTSYTLTDDTLAIGERNIPYTLTDGLISFDSWTTDDNGHTITWSLSPEENPTENTSSTTVDTKNLTSDQLKEWVSAVLDKQFSSGRTSFPYKLSVENHDGYAYVRVEHSEQQIDTLDMFRINSSGQLEQQDLSNGYPATYKVVSSKFMDTSAVSANKP